MRRGERGARATPPAASACSWRRSPPATSSSGCCAAALSGRSFGDEDAELLRAVANQTAVGLKKAELIERLTAENIVKDMFEALAAGSVQTAEAKAGEARCDLSRPHVFLHVERAPAADETLWPELAGRVQSRLRRLHRRAFFDARHDSLRALVPLPALDQGAADGLRLACEELGAELGVDIGISDAERGAESARRRMREAADAARIARSLAAAGGAVSYERLGAYRYLVNLELDEAPRDRYGQAVGALIDYDRARNAHLVDTLERYLAARCSVAASARALYIHPNTVQAAARADPADHEARPARGGPAVARARAQGGAAAARARGDRRVSAASGAAAPAAQREPDPEGAEADDVRQEHEQDPPRLDEERVRLVAQLDRREVAHDQECDQQDDRHLADDDEQDHGAGHPIAAGWPP